VKYELYNTGSSVRLYCSPGHCAPSRVDHKVSGTVSDRVSKMFYTVTLVVANIDCMTSTVYEGKLMDNYWKVTAMVQKVSRWQNFSRKIG